MQSNTMMLQSSVPEPVELGNVQLVIVESLRVLTDQPAVKMNITPHMRKSLVFLVHI